MKERLVIGTRGSALALSQTHWVIQRLLHQFPDLQIDIQTIVTRGDATQIQNVPLSSFQQKGIFATEIENALLSNQIDFAVHSMKDLAHTLPNGLCIAAVPIRESAADALIGYKLDQLPHGARVGTGSVRRRALLRSRRPDLQLLEIRGNVDTRIRKLEEGQYDAICLAVAGLSRLGLSDRITETLDSGWFIPDPGQGALAIECRSEDMKICHILSVLNDPVSQCTTTAERSFLREIGGSCNIPVGAYGKIVQDTLQLTVMAAGTDDLVVKSVVGSIEDPVEVGKQAASLLIN